MSLPTNIWYIKELLTSILICYVILKNLRNKGYNAINFHIAYPLCIHLHIYKILINLPIIVTEHWSGYHFNFGVKKKLKRIIRIFRNNVTWIVVSQSLKRDLIVFSENNLLKPNVISNVVNSEIFYFKNLKRDESFFMISYWREPKNPLIVLKSFKKLLKIKPTLNLRIAGYGPKQNEIVEDIKVLFFEDVLTVEETFET